MTSTAPRPASSAIEGPGPRSLFDGQRTAGEQLLVKAFVVVPLLALLAAVPLAWGWGLSWTDIGLAVSFYFLSGLGITVGFHRHFTHRAFKATRALKIGLAITGSMAFQGPIINWVADHRRHHAFTDKEGDPHSPWLFGTSPLAVAKGFVHAHLSWLFARDKTNAARFAPDLLADRDLQRVHQQFIGWSMVSLAAPALLGGVITWSWWGALTGFFWAGLVRLAVLNHVTWSINSICHMIGSRPFTVRDRSTNFWPMAIGPDPSRHFTGYLNSGLTVMMMAAVVVILVNAAWRCTRVLTGRVPLHVADVA